MSQTWNPPDQDFVSQAAVQTDIPNMLETLRTLFSGTSDPSATVAYMLFADTTNGQLKMRNAGDSAFDILGALNKDHARRREPAFERLALSASSNGFICCPHYAGKLKKIVLVCDTASSSSSGNEWQFALKKNTSTDLFSGTVGTFTALGGVGGGELAVDTAYALTPDQNDSIAIDDVLEFQFLKVGTVTTLAVVAVFCEWTFAE